MTNVSNSGARPMLELNGELLEDAVEVLSSIDDATYVRRAELFDGQRIGGHIRHIVEFYECLFEGAGTGTIDYAARRRDQVIESNRRAALERVTALGDRLRADTLLSESIAVRVQPEDSMCGCFGSSLGRELEVVASHTVHHFALIAVVLRYFGQRVPAEFGVSKATLRYRATAA